MFIFENGIRELILATHVDVIIVVITCKSNVESLYQCISRHFKMIFESEAKEYLGYSIYRNRKDKILRLNQQENVIKILENFPPKKLLQDTIDTL